MTEMNCSKCMRARVYALQLKLAWARISCGMRDTNPFTALYCGSLTYTGAVIGRRKRANYVQLINLLFQPPVFSLSYTTTNVGEERGKIKPREIIDTD